MEVMMSYEKLNRLQSAFASEIAKFALNAQVLPDQFYLAKMLFLFRSSLSNIEVEHIDLSSGTFRPSIDDEDTLFYTLEGASLNLTADVSSHVLYLFGDRSRAQISVSSISLELKIKFEGE